MATYIEYFVDLQHGKRAHRHDSFERSRRFIPSTRTDYNIYLVPTAIFTDLRHLNLSNDHKWKMRNVPTYTGFSSAFRDILQEIRGVPKSKEWPTPRDLQGRDETWRATTWADNLVVEGISTNQRAQSHRILPWLSAKRSCSGGTSTTSMYLNPLPPSHDNPFDVRSAITLSGLNGYQSLVTDCRQWPTSSDLDVSSSEHFASQKLSIRHGTMKETSAEVLRDR